MFIYYLEGIEPLNYYYYYCYYYYYYYYYVSVMSSSVVVIIVLHYAKTWNKSMCFPKQQNARR
jgi:hypothetical protein